jgi:hypothetical protein
MVKNAANPFTIKNKTTRYKAIPGWSTHCKHLYNSAKEYLRTWDQNGRMRSGVDYDKMKSAKNKFKSALEKCKKDETRMKKNGLSSSFAIKNKKEFWKDVKKLKPLNKLTTNKLDGKTDSKEIINIFKTKYKNILNNIKCQSKPFNYNENMYRIKELARQSNFRITPSKIMEAIDSLNDCLGFDGLHSNHFKLCDTQIANFMSKLFNSFLFHGYIPGEMLEGQIKPIIKSKLNKLDDSDNYRPVTISSNCLKIFEYCLIKHLEHRLQLDYKQLGFQKNTSTIMATTLLKETVSQYCNKGSKVYTAFLDLSKAFDCLNHYKLLNRLSNSTVSPNIVNILRVMYGNQFVHVNFNNVNSDPFQLKNGVRQGAILSPLLFNFYINDVIKEITSCGFGCILHNNRHNIQAYADDFTILAPSITALQKLLNKIYVMLNNLDLSLNTKKSVCMVFSSKPNNDNPNLYINNTKVSVVQSYTYLGIILRNDMNIKDDIIRAESTFLIQFWSIYRKFNFCETSVLAHLFQTHTSSFYGCETWSNIRGTAVQIKSLSINYHKSIKRICNKPWRYSNHDVCDESGLMTFNHLINYRQINFIFNLISSKSKCMYPYLTYFLYDSFILNNIRQTTNKTYNIPDVINNELSAIKACIYYTQRREDRSSYYHDAIV